MTTRRSFLGRMMAGVAAMFVAPKVVEAMQEEGGWVAGGEGYEPAPSERAAWYDSLHRIQRDLTAACPDLKIAVTIAENRQGLSILVMDRTSTLNTRTFVPVRSSVGPLPPDEEMNIRWHTMRCVKAVRHSRRTGRTLVMTADNIQHDVPVAVANRYYRLTGRWHR